MRSLLQKTLAEQQLSVTACADSESALAALSSSSFNLVFSDIYMPGISGLEFAAYCREKYPSMPIIIMTGAPSIGNLKLARNSGVVYYLPKPFSRGELAEILKLAISWNIGKLLDRASRRYLALVDNITRENPGKLLRIKIALKEFFSLSGDAGEIRRFVYDEDISANSVFGFLSEKNLK
jgi:DNA-binding NtrC family response regulator